jgi:hypothetical protein
MIRFSQSPLGNFVFGIVVGAVMTAALFAWRQTHASRYISGGPHFSEGR